jgi:ketosteroid isomerase-like protein
MAMTMLVASCASIAIPPEQLSRAIIGTEEARLAAFRADDKPEFNRLVADELTMVHSNGEIGGKAEELAAMRPSTPERPLPTLHLEDTRVRGYGDTAVLTGSLVERRDQAVVLRLRFTNVYARRTSGWVLVAGQLTRAAAN